jgi:hypothetical protein
MPPSGPNRIASSSCNAANTSPLVRPDPAVAGSRSLPVGGRPVAANPRRIAWCTAFSTGSSGNARARQALSTSPGRTGSQHPSPPDGNSRDASTDPPSTDPIRAAAGASAPATASRSWPTDGAGTACPCSSR